MLQRDAHSLDSMQGTQPGGCVCAEPHPLPLSLRLSEKKLYASARKPPPREFN